VARPKSEDKKQALLEAATVAFAQSGIAASTSLIARNAGVAEGTLHLVFARADANDAPLVDNSDLAELQRRLDQGYGGGMASVIATDSGATLTLHLPLQP